MLNADKFGNHCIKHFNLRLLLDFSLHTSRTHFSYFLVCDEGELRWFVFHLFVFSNIAHSLIRTSVLDHLVMSLLYFTVVLSQKYYS